MTEAGNMINECVDSKTLSDKNAKQNDSSFIKPLHSRIVQCTRCNVNVKRKKIYIKAHKKHKSNRFEFETMLSSMAFED